MYDIHFDMEMQDPDDIFTLCILATHPRSNLKGVTVFPGGLDQVGLAKHVLRLVGRPDVPVGAAGLDDGKSRVSAFHYNWLGKIDPATPDFTEVELLLKNSGDTTLVTGAPLRNVKKAFDAWVEADTPQRSLRASFYRFWTCQGGFAGDNVVPPERRLEKFKGRLTCPTFNLGGDRKAAEALLGTHRMPFVNMVSKNVCHGVIFGPGAVERFPSHIHKGLDLLLDGMRYYIKKVNPQGKALHDVIAAGLTINPTAATWASGYPYYEKGGWGFQTLEEAHGPEFTWDTGVGDYARRITTSVDVSAVYEAWVN